MYPVSSIVINIRKKLINIYILYQCMSPLKRNVACFLFCKENNSFAVFNPECSENGQGYILKIAVTDEKACNKEIQKEVFSKYHMHIDHILSLDWGTIIKKNDEEYMEMYYIVFVKNNTTYKNVYFRWMEFHQFIESLVIDEEKRLLHKVLLQGVNNEKYFNKKERGG